MDDRNGARDSGSIRPSWVGGLGKRKCAVHDRTLKLRLGTGMMEGYAFLIEVRSKASFDETSATAARLGSAQNSYNLLNNMKYTSSSF